MKKSQLIEYLKEEGFSKRILEAFSKVKREKFVPKDLWDKAYEDRALPLGKGATISQPYTIATMLDMLNLKSSQKVLEIGSGCGYVLALMSEITGEKGEIYGIEIIKELTEKSKQNTKNYKNIKIYNRDGKKGFEEKAPFDRILISAASEEISKEILNQLKNNGVLVAPIGPKYLQDLVAIKRYQNNFKIISSKPGFVFVKLV